MTGNEDLGSEHTASGTASARQYAERKRLRGDQVTALEVFLNEPPSLREAKMTNIRKYAPAVPLSSKINVYKGDGITQILTDIIKRHRFDLPPGVLAIVQDALTQTRSKVKKEIAWSLKVNKSDELRAPLAQHKNIYQLAQAIVKGTQCSVNVVLCARIAVMRAVYLEHPSGKFWDEMEQTSRADPQNGWKRRQENTRGFRQALEADQAKHGVKGGYELDETVVDEFQQKIDDLIDIRVVDAATSSSAQGAVVV
ncbi:hypothetical protein B0H14DRAFT_3528761 [Mycena olivaceomarginata]|nr:hypothetical protein B0H14DRAFT_3528761 [Mycena olivaceomarginata]